MGHLCARMSSSSSLRILVKLSEIDLRNSLDYLLGKGTQNVYGSTYILSTIRKGSVVRPYKVGF